MNGPSSDSSGTSQPAGHRPPLDGIRVVDVSTVVAGPTAARYLGDFGADVIKVERPSGDGVRSMGWRDPADGVTLWWKFISRNKRCIALDLKDPEDREVFLAICAEADVLIENFRPGTLERLGLGPDELWKVAPRLIVTRVTGFGQDGPYAGRPGFASIAEAMSGFVAVNGEEDGQPLLPPIALTDEVTGLAAAFATMVALHAGVPQVVDVNLLESVFQMMGPLISAWRTEGYLQPRLGSGIPYSVPRGTYRCADGTWVAVSASSDTVAPRVLELLGVQDDPRFATFQDRADHREEIDQLLSEWVGARSLDEVMERFEAAHAAVAPVMTMADIDADPHYRAREVVTEVDGFPMQNLIARLSATPGVLRWTGRPLDADGDEIRAEVSGASLRSGSLSDEDAMEVALEEARAAGAEGEVPIGAVVLDPEGRLIARRHNERERSEDPTAHAEVLALRDASRVLDDWRLVDCTLVVTLEPCPMCAGAAVAGRVGRVVYGAPSMDAGSTGSLYHLGADPRLNHQFETRHGVRAEECAELLTSYFAARRPAGPDGSDPVA